MRIRTTVRVTSVGYVLFECSAHTEHSSYRFFPSAQHTTDLLNGFLHFNRFAFADLFKIFRES